MAKRNPRARDSDDTEGGEIVEDNRPEMHIIKFRSLVPANAPDIVKAAIHNLDEMIEVSLNHSRVFKGRRYFDPRIDSAIRAQEQAMRIMRVIGPESTHDGGAIDAPPTPEQLKEARRVLTKMGWRLPEGEKTDDETRD